MTVRAVARSFVRRAVLATVCPEGTVRTIVAGPCRGLRYRIFPEFGLSPLRGAFEPDLQRLMVEHVPTGSVAYDVGANYGMHTLLLARCTGRFGHVYAFEPVPEICSELEHNVRLNGFTQVTILPFAVAADNSVRRFVCGANGSTWHISAESEWSDSALTIETVSLDEFVFHRGNRAPHFIKIDVEGGESSVLAGASRLLREVRPVMIVELHSPEQDMEVGRLLSSNGYRAYRIQHGAITHIADLTKAWPAPGGLWGQIIAFPKTEHL